MRRTSYGFVNPSDYTSYFDPSTNAYVYTPRNNNNYRGFVNQTSTAIDNVFDAGWRANRTHTIRPGNGIKGFFKNNFGWNKGSGLKAFGHNVGKWGNVAGGIVQGVQALSGASKLGKTRKGIDTTVDDILTMYAKNPLAVSYLTEDQKNTLRNLKNGAYGKGASFKDYLPNSVGDVLRPMLGAGIGFLTGGIPGALINGIGGHVNEGIINANESQQKKLTDLNALYDVLQQAELEHQMLQRANAQRMMYSHYM